MPVNLQASRPEDHPALRAFLLDVWQGDDGAVQYHGQGRHSGVVAWDGDVAGQVAGQVSRVAGYAHTSRSTLHPAHVYVGVHVHPDFRRRGLGHKLWNAVVSGLPGQGLHGQDLRRTVKTALYDTDRPSLRFLEQRGLRVSVQTEQPTLNPTRLAPEQVAQWQRAAQNQGFELLAMTHLDDSNPALAHLHAAVYAHTHQHDPPAPLSADRAAKLFLGDDLRPEWLWVARHQGVLAGVASVRTLDQPNQAELGWCGVVPAFAAYGSTLTLALSALALQAAAYGGIRQIGAELDSTDPNALHLRRELPWQAGTRWLTLTGLPRSG